MCRHTLSCCQSKLAKPVYFSTSYYQWPSFLQARPRSDTLFFARTNFYRVNNRCTICGVVAFFLCRFSLVWFTANIWSFSFLHLLWLSYSGYSMVTSALDEKKYSVHVHFRQYKHRTFCYCCIFRCLRHLFTVFIPTFNINCIYYCIFIPSLNINNIIVFLSQLLT